MFDNKCFLKDVKRGVCPIFGSIPTNKLKTTWSYTPVVPYCSVVATFLQHFNIKPWFQTSDFHETFTKSCLALNQSRKDQSDSLPAIHGQKMQFLLEFWLIRTKGALREGFPKKKAAILLDFECRINLCFWHSKKLYKLSKLRGGR